MRVSGRIVGLCAMVGTRYGAFAGALYAAILVIVTVLFGSFQDPSGPKVLVLTLAAAILYGLVGLMVGAGAGLVCGVIGGIIGGPIGWALAGALGGGAAGVPVAQFIITTADVPLSETDKLWLWAQWSLGPALTGATIGAAIGAGLRRKRSRLPMLTRLAARIQAAEEEERRASIGGQTEPTPARRPRE